MNLLNDCAEDGDVASVTENNAASNGQLAAVSASAGPLTAVRRTAANVTALRNVTVTAMSNLLSANIDSGLMHAIGAFTSLSCSSAHLPLFHNVFVVVVLVLVSVCASRCCACRKCLSSCFVPGYGYECSNYPLSLLESSSCAELLDAFMCPEPVSVFPSDTFPTARAVPISSSRRTRGNSCLLSFRFFVLKISVLCIKY